MKAGYKQPINFRQQELLDLLVRPHTVQRLCDKTNGTYEAVRVALKRLEVKGLTTVTGTAHTKKRLWSRVEAGEPEPAVVTCVPSVPSVPCKLPVSRYKTTWRFPHDQAIPAFVSLSN